MRKPNDSMDIPAGVYRQGGVWKLVVRLPDWLWDDIRESEQPMTLIMPDSHLIGASYWYEGSEYLLANVKPELIQGKK